MADITPERLLKKKSAVTRALAAVSWPEYGLADVDERLEEYCKKVAAEPSRHNLWEQLAVHRFLRMCRKYGLSARRVRVFFAFYESLTFPTARGQGHYKLSPVQCFQFASIFGFVDKKGCRVVKEAVLYVPRKFSKTTSSAAFAVWDLLFGDANAECYTGANSADQAKKCFDVIRRCVWALDPEESRFVVNEQLIKSIFGGRTALAQCLTANARTKDGLNASTIIMDEFSQADDAELLNVLTTSMGVRTEPLTVIITTASDKFEGPFYQMLQGYKALLLGEYRDYSVFCHLFEPDIGDEEGDERTWAKVHPHLGLTVSRAFYRREWAKAQRNGAEALLAFRTKLLNTYTTAPRRSWLSRKDVQAAARPFDPTTLTSTTVAMIGFDLSKCDDLTACCSCYHDRATQKYHFVVDYFFPRGALSGHPNEALYTQWATEGWLHLTEGRTVDYNGLVECIQQTGMRVPIMGIGYDAYGATDVANHLRALGYKKQLFGVPQTYSYFTDPVFALEKWIKDGSAFVDDNPITEWCFANCYLDENTVGFKPQKRTHDGKIDGAIAILMCARQYLYWRRRIS